jgi:hypothetical protein
VAKSILARTELRDTLDFEAFRWAVLNSHAISELSDQSGCMVVRYEDLCADPYAVMRKIFLNINLPWDTQVERFIHHSTTSMSRRFYGLHREAKYLNHWQTMVPEETKERILRVVADTPAGDLYTG